jgi:hypothetical protein
MILLLGFLLALPASASTQAPYLSANDIPAQKPTLLVSEPGAPLPYPVSSDSAIPLPVTGR